MAKDQQIDLIEAAGFGAEIRQNVPLATFTTMKVGGMADYFVSVASLDVLATLIQWARSISLPYFLLGGGSNILISDAGVRGLVINNRCREVTVEGEAELVAQSGAAMAGAARQSVNAGLSGLEWAVSVPGTVGGAVVNNAGAHGGEVKDNLHSAALIDSQGAMRSVTAPELAYAYRSSSLKRQRLLEADFKPVVLAAVFALTAADPEVIRDRAAQFLRHRRSTQPIEASLGSTFVNPPGDFAGRLIEEAGMKGERSGGIEVSTTHANFLVNPGGVGSATALDVIKLIHRIQDTVAKSFGIVLEPEVQLAGDWSQSKELVASLSRHSVE